MRDDLIADLLESEIVDDRINVYELNSEDYTARIRNYRLYY